MASPSIDPLTMGCLRKATMAARVMKGMYVSLTPLRCSYFDFSFSRSLTMRVMSTLKTVWTWGLMRLDSTMRWAMMERIFDMGTSSPGSGWGAAGLGAAGAGAETAGAGAAGFGPFSKWLTMSVFVMRPEAPVPATWVRSTLLSFAILRTSGEERTRSPSDTAGAGAAAVGTAAGAGAAPGGTDFPEAPPITATTVLIMTVEPSGTLISERTPATGDGISASTLSVEISKIGSSR